VSERDFFKHRFSEDELRDLLQGSRPADAFAWRSPRARALSLDPGSPRDEAVLLRLMLAEPYLLRRPVIVIGGRTIFGFDRRGLEAAIGAG
jgi:arsenate reductase-like glutaredoxin family protein